MAKITRQTQKIFGSSAGFDQIAQFGSLNAGTPTFTTNIATIQGLSNYLVGWFNAVIGGNSPAIEDMNALCYLFAYQLGYILQEGIPEWDSGTTYYAGSIINNAVFVFTVTSANATAGATYTNNGNTFTVENTITAGTTLTCSGTTGAPAASGTLIKASGTGDANITFSANAVTTGLYLSIADNNTGNSITNTSYWQAVVPTLGSVYQHLAVNVAGTATEYTYNNFNIKTAPASLTIPSAYSLNTAALTLGSGITYTVAGSIGCLGPLTLQSGAVLTIQSGGIVTCVGPVIVQAGASLTVQSGGSIRMV